MSEQANARRKAAPAPMSAARWIDICCIALILSYALLLARSVELGLWIVDRSGAPAHADFSVFWASARLVWFGRAASAYDWTSVRETLEQMSGQPFPSGAFPFFYPPLMLLILAPLGAFAYAPAAALWIAATFAAYLRAAFALLRVRGLLLAAAAPAALWCICIGQNGVLSAALFAVALMLLDRRPVIAGILIALLSFKPQLGVLIPFALVASGRWRALASAVAASVTLWLAAGVVLGFSTYAGFMKATHDAQHIFLVAGQLPWFKLQSVYGLLRTLDAPASLAGVSQAAVSLLTAASVILLWRSRARFALKAAALTAGALAVSPYVQIYDFPIATIAILFLIRDSEEVACQSWEAAALTLAFFMPLAFSFVNLPVGPAVFLLLGVVIAARWLRALAADQDAAQRENFARA
ncbi:MAG: glycosyltransferase family 87 protein [Alphaproteobacteria bacterium]